MLLAGMALVVSASVAHAQIPVTKDTRAAVRTTTTTVTPTEPGRIIEVSTGDLEFYRGATDANIVAHILTADSLEIEISRLALARSTNPTVREFAQMMIDHHSRNSTDFHAMQHDEDIGIQPMANDPLANHLRSAHAHLRTLSGADFDRAYIRTQVMHHDADAAALAQMADMARDDDLEQDIEEKLLPVVRQHLSRARDIAIQLGVDVSAYRMTTP